MLLRPPGASLRAATTSGGQGCGSLALVQIAVRSPCLVSSQGCLLAVPQAVTKVDDKAYQHPHRKPHPCALVQLHHEIDVHEDAQDGKDRQEGHLKRQLGLALRLPPDDDRDHRAEEG